MFCVWVVASVLVVVVCVVGRHCRARRRRSHRGSSLLAAVCRGVTRRCGVSWLVAGVAAGFRGRALCWSLEGSQLHSESLEGGKKWKEEEHQQTNHLAPTTTSTQNASLSQHRGAAARLTGRP
ncbi:hypothetical protein JHK87_035168 [Glycine soja]|nr:hypothetical protein JHK87_035168 [Glycine soja]